MQPLIPNIIELEKKYQFHAADAVYDDEILNQYYRHCKFLSDYQMQFLLQMLDLNNGISNSSNKLNLRVEK